LQSKCRNSACLYIRELNELETEIEVASSVLKHKSRSSVATTKAKKKTIFPPINIVKSGSNSKDSHTIGEVRNFVTLEEDEMDWDAEEDEDIIRLERRYQNETMPTASSSSSCLAYAFKFVLRLIDLFLERITNVEQILLDLVNAFDVLYK